MEMKEQSKIPEQLHLLSHLFIMLPILPLNVTTHPMTTVLFHISFLPGISYPPACVLTTSNLLPPKTIPLRYTQQSFFPKCDERNKPTNDFFYPIL